MSGSGISLPYPYFVGDYEADTFEDITSKNIIFLASQMGGTARMRFLHGVVSSAGAVVSGTPGWTPSHLGTGSYRITFDSQFSSGPSWDVTAVTGVANGLATTSQLDVTTFSIGGAATDQPFSFSVFL